jgi:vacuolar protein sorting-associated protein 18
MSFDPSSGYIAGASNIDDQTELQETTLPIFNVERVSLQFNVSADFVAAQVANNVLVLALGSGRVLRIDLERPGDVDGTCCPACDGWLSLGETAHILKSMQERFNSRN